MKKSGTRLKTQKRIIKIELLQMEDLRTKRSDLEMAKYRYTNAEKSLC